MGAALSIRRSVGIVHWRWNDLPRRPLQIERVRQSVGAMQERTAAAAGDQLAISIATPDNAHSGADRSAILTGMVAQPAVMAIQ